MDWEVFRPSRASSVCLILLSFSFLLMTFHLTKRVQTLRSFLFYWISPTQESAVATIKLAEDVGIRFVELVRAHRENLTLKEKMLKLSLVDARYQETLLENQRLRDLLDLKLSLQLDAVPAVVSGRDAQNWMSSIWIDRGTQGGIEQDSPVLSVQSHRTERSQALGGVVGRVLERGLITSKVLLISDPLSSVAAWLPRTGEQGLVQGQGYFSITVEYLDPAADIQVGDEVLTSGLGGLFPAGLPIGRIIKVVASPSGFKRAELQPAVHLNEVREVLVLKVKKAQ